MIKHRTILKSVIDFNHDKVELNYLIENLSFLKSSVIKFSFEIHERIYSYICEHSEKFVDNPSYSRLVKYFEEDPDIFIFRFSWCI